MERWLKVRTRHLEHRVDRRPGAESTAPVHSSIHPVFRLQQTTGNQAVQRLLQRGQCQARLAINEPGDVHEQEAERTAEEVMRAAPGPLVQRWCACGGVPGPDWECAACRAKRLARQGHPVNSATPSAAPPIVQEVLRSPGQPLDTATRAFFEPRFGYDFGQVRVHIDARAADSAQAVNARAYTVGKDLVFGAGQFDPASRQGRQLLAHELTHVIQQTSLETSRMQRKEPPASAPAGAGPTTPVVTQETDGAIDALDLSATAKAAAKELKKKHPDITFTSGRRSVAEQAEAMASNIVSSKNRKWIEKTYLSATALQKWVDDNPKATSEEAIATGLEKTMNDMSDADRGKISKHLSGEAFDVQPQKKDAEAIKKDIRGLPGLSKFLEEEGGLVRWHAQFKKMNQALAGFDPLEEDADEAAEQLVRSETPIIPVSLGEETPRFVAEPIPAAQLTNESGLHPDQALGNPDDPAGGEMPQSSSRLLDPSIKAFPSANLTVQQGTGQVMNLQKEGNSVEIRNDLEDEAEEAANTLDLEETVEEAERIESGIVSKEPELGLPTRLAAREAEKTKGRKGPRKKGKPSEKKSADKLTVTGAGCVPTSPVSGTPTSSAPIEVDFVKDNTDPGEIALWQRTGASALRTISIPGTPKAGHVTIPDGIPIANENDFYELDRTFTNRKGVVYGGFRKRTPVRFDICQLKPAPTGDDLLFARAIFAEGVDAGEFPRIRDVIFNRINWVKEKCPGDEADFGNDIRSVLEKPGQFASVSPPSPKFLAFAEELKKHSGPCQFTTPPRLTDPAQCRLVNNAIAAEAAGNGHTHQFIFFRSNSTSPSPRAVGRERYPGGNFYWKIEDCPPDRQKKKP